MSNAVQLDYLDYYGMTSDPFDGSLLLFSSVAGRSALLDQATQLLSFSELIPVIYGPSGSGKSHCLVALMRRLEEQFQVRRFDARAFVDSHVSVMNYLAERLGLIGYAHAQRAIESYLAEQAPSVVVLVDDFDVLDDSSQQAILALTELGLRLGLTLSQPSEAHRHGYEWHPLPLQPLSDQDAVIYLNQYFKRVGVAQGVPIEAKMLARLNANAQGLPGKLNSLVQQHLRYQVKRQHAEPWALPKWHLISGALVVVLILVSFWWQFQQQNQSSEQAVALEPSAQPSPLFRPLVDELSQAQQELATAEGAERSEQPEASDQDQASLAGLSLRERLALANQVPLEASASPAPAEVTPAPTQAASPSPSPRPQVSPAATASTPRPAPSPGLALPAWLAQVNPNHYTHQFFGSWELEQANNYRSRLRLSQDTAVVATERDGRTWYVVIAGHYSNQAQARAALAELPATLQEQGAWARTFRSIGVP